MDVQNELLKFIYTYTGRSDVGDTPQNIGQCVGLSEKWIDVFGYPHVWGNAKDLLTNADPNFYEIIFNTPTNFPQAGDIMVLNWGEFGHTGVVVSGADANQYSMFEQNDHTPSDPSGLCEVMQHSYNGVIGWLRMKNLSIPVVPVSSVDTQTISLAEYNKLQIQFDTVKKQLEDLQKGSDLLSNEVNNYHAMQALGYNTVDDINRELKTKDDSILSLSKENAQISDRNRTLAGEVEKFDGGTKTTFELSQKAITENEAYKEVFQQIAKMLSLQKLTKVNLLTRIDQLVQSYNDFMTHLDNEQKKKNPQIISVPKKVLQQGTQTGIDLVMQLFNMIPSKKGVN